MARLGRVPKTADEFEWGGLRFEVVDMDGRRIDKVMVSRIELKGLTITPAKRSSIGEGMKRAVPPLGGPR